jgi:cation:H+ antiporter
MLLSLAVGLTFLILGAEALVRGASRLARAWGVPSLVIGLTVVAFGTSAPEMAVSLTSGLAGRADIALGNVIGSNIFNVLFILGVSALIAPLVVSAQLVRLDVPVMIAVSVVAVGMSLDGRISRLDGVILFSGIVGYTAYLAVSTRREKTLEGGTSGTIPPRILPNILLVLTGLGILVLGSRWFLDGSVALARHLGVTELVIGLTVVAAGTSLPEVATSVVASMRGERDIAVGNVVGSNIFNVLAVLGMAALVAPRGIVVSPAALYFDLPIMTAVAVACLPVFFTGNVIARWEGALFLGYYVAYALYLVLAATEHASLPLFRIAMLWFVLPLTALTLAAIAVRALRQQRAARG